MAEKRFRLSAHEMWLDDGTGIVHYMYSGILTGPDMAEMFAMSVKWHEEVNPGGPWLYLIDNRKLKGVRGDARKDIAKLTQTIGDCYTAIYGASFALRVVLNLVFKAASLVTSRVVLRYAANESEAREWLIACRRAHIARAAG